jgi:hypothetical protein
MFDTEKYIVKYEIGGNMYRKPTKWESLRNRVRNVLNQVFVLPLSWAYGALKCALCSRPKSCSKEIDLANYRISSKLMQNRIDELESENEVLRHYANNALREVHAFREELATKKKAVKKRPLLKKKNKKGS